MGHPCQPRPDDCHGFDTQSRHLSLIAAPSRWHEPCSLLLTSKPTTGFKNGGAMSTAKLFRATLAAALVAVLSVSAARAVDMQAGDWKFSVDGNINVHYIYSS